MGFFDFFGNLSEEISKFTDAGMQMHIDELIYRMSRTSKKTEVMGYSKALKIKFQKLDDSGADDYELERYFDMSFERGSHTEMGKQAMFSVMQRRGLAHKEGGYITRDY